MEQGACPERFTRLYLFVIGRIIYLLNLALDKRVGYIYVMHKCKKIWDAVMLAFKMVRAMCLTSCPPCISQWATPVKKVWTRPWLEPVHFWHFYLRSAHTLSHTNTRHFQISCTQIQVTWKTRDRFTASIFLIQKQNKNCL